MGIADIRHGIREGLGPLELLRGLARDARDGAGRGEPAGVYPVSVTRGSFVRD